jgi:uncharacterized membrane protein
MKSFQRNIHPQIIALIGAAAFFVMLILALVKGNLSSPHFQILIGQPIQVYVHLIAALLTFGLGLVLFAAPKGNFPHRALGWVWSGLMLTVAASSLWITGLNGKTYSPIHLLSAWVLVILPVALVAARRHRVDIHSRIMTGLFLGAMILAGGFTFFPGRLLWRVFFAGSAG